MSELTIKTEFAEVVNLIKSSRHKALQAVNAELITIIGKSANTSATVSQTKRGENQLSRS
jgi:hypothetical protein